MNSTVLWVIAGILVLGGLAYWMFGMQQPAPNTTTGTLQGTVLPGGANGVEPAPTGTQTEPKTVTVLYNASGFSPATVTINRGDSVGWTNNGGGNMWVAADEHPSHTNYSGTTRQEHCDDATDVSFDQCKNGITYSFKFDKAGTWGYHNHSNPRHTGTIVVQ